MKTTFKLSILAILLCFFLACGEDEKTCLQADWIGTYTGTADCDGNSDAATVTITASGSDAIVIRYVTGAVTTTFDPLTVTGCTIERTNSAGGVTGSVEATLNGDNFTLKEVLTGGGFNTNCDVTATRN